MDDNEYDGRHPPNPFGVNHQNDYGSSNKTRLLIRNTSYPPAAIDSQYIDDEDEDYEEDVDEFKEEEESDDEDDEDIGVRRIDYNEKDENADDDALGSGKDETRSNHKMRIEDIDFDKHPKKRKLKNLISNYEFAPRVAAPSSAPPSALKPLSGGRSFLADYWTEHETFVLLDAWGNSFLQNGRKSLRSEEWQEVAEKVSRESKTRRTDTQCRNRLDTLKKKYKKEKMTPSNTTSSWIYFKKMDELMSSTPQQASLSRGLESGRNLFAYSTSYPKCANELDDMSSSGILEAIKGKAENSNGLPPRKRSFGGDNNEGSSVKIITDCMHQFSDVYKNIEKNQRQQMEELEKMRMDFHADLEMHKRQILEKARTEIAKILQDDEENDASAGNISG